MYVYTTFYIVFTHYTLHYSVHVSHGCVMYVIPNKEEEEEHREVAYTCIKLLSLCNVAKM